MASCWLAATAAATIALLAAAGTVAAHPLGGVRVNRYARLEQWGDSVRLEYRLDFGPEATRMLVPAADFDHDGRYSQVELEAYALSLQTTYGYGLQLSQDGAPVAFVPGPSTVGYRPDALGQPHVLAIMTYSARLRAGTGVARLAFADRNFEDDQVWKELVVRPAGGAEIVADPDLAIEWSHGLTDYPPDFPRMTNRDHAEWTWQQGTGAPAPAPPAQSAGEPFDAPPGSVRFAPATAARPTERGHGGEIARTVAVVAVIVVAAAGLFVVLQRRPAQGRD